MRPPMSKELNLAAPATKTASGVYDSLMQAVGLLVTKTNTCNGDGAQTDNLFTVTGTVKILSIWGVCTEATNSTDLADNSLAVYDGTATLELTDSGTPTDCSGMVVGDFVVKKGPSNTDALLFHHIAAANLSDDEAYQVFVSKKTGASTYIQHLFNGNADTDVDIKWYVRYIPLSDDGAIAAV